jgi:hypothetical protein
VIFGKCLAEFFGAKPFARSRWQQNSPPKYLIHHRPEIVNLMVSNTDEHHPIVAQQAASFSRGYIMFSQSV